MKHYINETTKEIFAFEQDGSQDDIIPTGVVPISDADLIIARTQQEQDSLNEAQIRFDALAYAEKRAISYPSLTEQADMAYWDRQNGTTTLDDAISAVKAEFPKPV